MNQGKFRCLGKNKNGMRCHNTMVVGDFRMNYTLKYKTLLCHKHRDQKVKFWYSSNTTSSLPVNVMYKIAQEIHHHKDFLNFSKVCLSSAKACSLLQKEKQKEFCKTQIDHL